MSRDFEEIVLAIANTDQWMLHKFFKTEKPDIDSGIEIVSRKLCLPMDERQALWRQLVSYEQRGSTDEMEWDMHYLVADIARTITLFPGDVLLSGTPAHSRPVQPGDVVEVAITGAPPHLYFEYTVLGFLHGALQVLDPAAERPRRVKGFSAGDATVLYEVRA